MCPVTLENLEGTGVEEQVWRRVVAYAATFLSSTLAFLTVPALSNLPVEEEVDFVQLFADDAS